MPQEIEPLVPTGSAIQEALGPRLRGLRILVIDADENVGRRARALLTRFGCQVTGATTAADALELAQAGGLDAFLLDVHLPEAQVFALFTRLCEILPHATPVLMTDCSYDTEHVQVQARLAGHLLAVYKPFLPDQVVTVLANAAPAPGGAA